MSTHKFTELRAAVPHGTWGPKSRRNVTSPGTPAQVKTLKERLNDPHGEPCGLMAGIGRKWSQKIAAAGAHCRDEGLLSGQFALAKAAANGCTGAETELAKMRAVYELHREPSSGCDPGDEWDEALGGAWIDAAGSASPTMLDPCKGGSGLGVEIITAAANAKTTLIAEGLDDAKICADYATADVTVLGLVGWDSWRRDGLPVAELGIVAGTNVVIVFAPEVTDDLDRWSSACGAQDACNARGATGAVFAQPPGTKGVRVGEYLESLPEENRAAALTYLLGAITKKPANKPLKRKLGAGVDSDLPPTNDTHLGTTWADANINRFRRLTDDKVWTGYRQGDPSKGIPGGWWRTTGADAAVGDSVMRFLDDYATPLAAAVDRARGGDAEQHEKLQRAYDALMSSNKQSAVETKASKYGPLHVSRDQLDQHPTKWCAANAVLDLETLKLYPHNPALLLTSGSNVPYIKGHGCPRFDQFLMDVLPNAEVRGYVMQVLFMAMIGRVKEHVLPVFIGSGRNGKGALIRIMLAVFGDAAVIVNSGSLLEQKFEKHEEEIAKLAGKRLAVAEEPKKGGRWNAARIKNWTGGDHLTGRFMHGNSFSFAPSHTLILTTNHRPTVDDGEAGFWERYREIPFTQSFYGREDLTLEPDILRDELPGVLNRLLEAGRDYLANGGLRTPVAVEVATADAKIESDTLAQFCADRITWTGNHEADRITNAELHAVLVQWWAVNRIRGDYPKLRGTFTKDMKQVLGIGDAENNPKKIGEGTASIRTWTGIRWGANSAEHSAESASNSAEPPNTDYYPPWTPPNDSAELPRNSAESLPSSVDQGTGEGAGQGVTSANSANSAKFELHGGGMRMNEEKSKIDKSEKFSPAVEPRKIENSTNSAELASDTQPSTPPRNGAIVTPISAAGTSPCPRCDKPLPAEKRDRHLSHCKSKAR